ncbi:MAG: CPBP family intramembrane glutamic endopeptidase [Myxococcota bacterium]
MNNAPPWSATVAWFIFTYLASWPMAAVVVHVVAQMQGTDIRAAITSGDATTGVAVYFGIHWTIAAWAGLQFFDEGTCGTKVSLGFRKVDIRWLLAAMAATVGLSVAISGTIYALGLEDYGVLARLRERFLSAEGVRWFVLASVLTIAPALGEEIFFRGFVLQSLAVRCGPPVAVFGSSLMFAVSHFDPLQSTLTFFLGMVIGWAVIRSGSLWTGIAAHAANNAFAAVLVSSRALISSAVLIASGLALFAVGAGFIWSMISRRPQTLQNKP